VARFTIQALKGNELGEAWPIVRSGPYPNLDWWLSEAAELIRNGGGVLAARAPTGRIHGVATFKSPADLAGERMLTVRLLISFELSRSAPARAALLRSLERIATRLECTHVILPLEGRSPLHLTKNFVAAA
jgi:hypothetical protein